MPCPGPFHLSYSVDYIYDFCPLPDPDVGLSVFVCDVENTSFHFCLCGRKFVLCLYIYIDSKVSGFVNFNCLYNLSRYLIDLSNPFVIQDDFLCLYFFNLTILLGMNLFLARSISSRIML